MQNKNSNGAPQREEDAESDSSREELPQIVRLHPLKESGRLEGVQE
jgi:hypothetical protein